MSAPIPTRFTKLNVPHVKRLTIQISLIFSYLKRQFQCISIGFNNIILSCREDLCVKLERLKLISQLDPTNRADCTDVPGQFTDDLQAVFVAEFDEDK